MVTIDLRCLNLHNECTSLGEISLSRMPCVGEHITFDDANGNSRIAKVIEVFHNADYNLVLVGETFALATYWRMQGIVFK